MAARSTFVWGLQRSGIHLVVNWLYSNYGGSARDTLSSEGLHPKFNDGFTDRSCGVAFHNNVGRFDCRRFELGDISANDFELAAARNKVTIFGIEDCALSHASSMPRHSETSTVLLLRDPLNLLASRLKGKLASPELYRVDEQFVEVYENYCLEFLGHTNYLGDKTLVSYNQFIRDRAYRDSLASCLGLENRDHVSEVSPYGGGSSFSGLGSASSVESLVTRYLQHPLPRDLLQLLLERPAILETCESAFGLDLGQLVGAV